MNCLQLSRSSGTVLFLAINFNFIFKFNTMGCSNADLHILKPSYWIFNRHVFEIFDIQKYTRYLLYINIPIRDCAGVSDLLLKEHPTKILHTTAGGQS